MKVFLSGVIALITIAAVPAAASAVVIPVNTTADEYSNGTDCSLREAITAAQTNTSFGGCPAGFAADTISLPAGEYKITRAGADEDNNATGDFDITGANPLDIQPADADARVVIDGNGLDRVFDDHNNGLLRLLALEVTGGKLTLIEDGGGIRNSIGVTALENVTVAGNSSAYQAGGVAVYSNLQVVNSTISGNRADGNGGGLYVPGGASMVLRSSTIYGNQADADGDGNGYGGGFAETAGLTVSFTNVLNVGNSSASITPTSSAYDCYSGPNFFPRYTLQGQPLGPLDCLVGFNPGTNLVSSDPKVDPVLAYNGGQTPTHNLLAGSPAIGAGGTAAPDECPAIDQNGVGRPAGSCDIGAVQYVPKPALEIKRLRPKRKAVRRGKARVITIVVRNSGEGVATAVKACLKLNRAARKGLRVRGKACRSLGTLEAGQVKRAKVRLVAKRKAKRKAYPVRATARGDGVAAKAKRFKVRVK